MSCYSHIPTGLDHVPENPDKGIGNHLILIQDMVRMHNTSTFSRVQVTIIQGYCLAHETLLSIDLAGRINVNEVTRQRDIGSTLSVSYHVVSHTAQKGI